MSRISKHIELRPPKIWVGGGAEVIREGGFQCPECHANGYHWALDKNDPTEHAEVKVPCRVCGGTGEVVAEVAIRWRAPERAREK